MSVDNPSTIRPGFWRDTALEDMTHDEWEALCDGCGKCCLLKLEDADTGEVEFTNVACKLFDAKTCRCKNYALRKQIVPDCVVVRPENIERIAYWMPETCAYRLLFDGYDLPIWHPLETGDRHAIVSGGHTMQDRTISETQVEEDDLEDHITHEVR